MDGILSILSSIHHKQQKQRRHSLREEVPGGRKTHKKLQRPQLCAAIAISIIFFNIFFKFAMGKASLDSLAAEATALADGDDTELSREERARKALECDCVAELREGPCGIQFSEAFYCFLTSEAEDQGSDCIKPFVAMQTCMAANPEAFVQYTGEDRKDSSAPDESTEVENRNVPVSASPPPGAIRNPIS